MSITIELPTEVKAALLADARAQGREAAALVVDLVASRYGFASMMAAVEADREPLRPPAGYSSRAAYVTEAMRLAPAFGVDQECAGGVAAGFADAEMGRALTIDQAQVEFYAAFGAALATRTPGKTAGHSV